jgi:15-cis-phytoene synthase
MSLNDTSINSEKKFPIFHNSGQQCSQVIIQTYSTSFASAVGLLHKDLRQSIYIIYGFVRIADEIVDTFHEYNKKMLPRNLRNKPIMITVLEYNIDLKLIEDFFKSMEMDLGICNYDGERYKEYIYVSSEVVGLKCLYVFCKGR